MDVARADPPNAPDDNAPQVFLVPHTHWDREWYEPFDRFLERLVAMMDGLLDLLSSEGAFGHFHLDGQTAMLDDYLAVRPERRADVERLARQGRLSVGPWCTQMDEFLVSGESLIRNLEWGMRRAAELTGDPSGGLRAGYLPDQFGHVGQMPQILRLAGLERALVWRGVPQAIDRTAFRWEAPDGSAVTAEYLMWGYSLGMGTGGASTAAELAAELAGAVQALRPHSARPDRVLITVGSDHAGPAATIPPMLAEANRIAGTRAEIGSISAYLDGPDPREMPTWRGELRSSARAYLLPNVYATRAHQKERRGHLEVQLERWAEPLAALVPGFEWPAGELEEAWRLMLWNGAHDSVCGCSVDQVARDVDARFDEVESLCEDVVERALEALAARMALRGWVYINPSPFERFGVPGLGWLVIPDDDAGPPWPRPARSVVRFPQLPLRVEDDRIVAGDHRLWLVDEGDVGDLYTFCPTDAAPPRGPLELVEGERGSAVARFPGVTVELRAELQGDAVMIGGPIRNEASDHRLRLHVALDRRADGSDALAPFEVVSRGLRSEGGTEPPSPTWPAHGAASAGGVSVFRRGVFEYEVCQEPPSLAVTALRCVGTISRPGFATRRGPAGPDIATPDAQMQGDHAVHLSIQRGVGRDELAATWEQRMMLLCSVRSAGGGDLPARGSLLDVQGAELSSVRRTGGGVEVRVWNPSSDPRTAVLDGREVPLRAAEIATVVVDR
jgi:glycosyl hydrolase family 38/alpha mannosidase-like protein